ncbi:MAG: VWA domain-containing protein [Chlamydiales bacterium]|nr:VWA domain-containing protein [Chlamydiales bacterium]
MSFISRFSHTTYSELSKPQTLEEKKAFLQGVDITVLIDGSKSMLIDDEKDGVKRCDLVREHAKRIIKTALSLDKDGVDVCRFNDTTVWKNNVKNYQEIDEFLQQDPQGKTHLKKALKEAFYEHFSRKKKNNDQRSIFLIFTDGIPDYEKKDLSRCASEVGQLIIDQAKKTDRKKRFKQNFSDGREPSLKTTELGIRFFQVGADPEATKYLKTLDEKLPAKVDIVHVGNVDELKNTESIIEAFINAIFG